MPPKTRGKKSTAPSPAPLSELPSAKAHETLEKAIEATGIDPEVHVPAVASAGSGKGKGKAVEQDEEQEQEQAEGSGSGEAEGEGEAGKEVKKLTPEERLAKMKDLRMKMNQSTQANRKSLIEDHQKSRTTAKEIARLEKQRKLAETLREKIDAEENGVDMERKKNWGWSIEQNDQWARKEAEKEERSNFEFDDKDSNAQRQYNKNITKMKPDLIAYQRQKEKALGLAPGTLVPIEARTSEGTKGTALVNKKDVASAVGKVDEFYRGNQTLVYGDNKPSEEAIDRVIGKINEDADKRNKAMKKRRAKDDDGDVTYINDRNKQFNKKINRYYDKYTEEIRANFERGTAL